MVCFGKGEFNPADAAKMLDGCFSQSRSRWSMNENEQRGLMLHFEGGFF